METQNENINQTESQNTPKFHYLFTKNEIDHNEFKQEVFKRNFKKGNIYIFTNIGLVASGKSTIINSLEENLIKNLGKENITFTTISSDKIRMEIEKQPKKENEDEQKYNNRISKSTKKVFDNNFHKTLENYEENKFNFIILDKNFFINTLKDLKR